MSRSSYLWIIGLSLVCLAGISLTFTDYGITWDEDLQARYGEMSLDYFLSGGRDTSYKEHYNLRYYGALFETVCAAIYRSTGFDPYATRHFCIALTGLLTVVAVMLLARRWRGWEVVVFAGLALLMMPRFYGHSFNNSKDIPFACCFAWAMLAIVTMLGARRILWRHAIVAGVAIGLALSMRMGGLLLFAFLAAGAVAKYVTRAEWRRGGHALGMIVVVAVAWAVMVAGWPWAHENVLINPIEAFRAITDFEAVKEIRFAGEFIVSKEVPRSYLPWYLLITTPLPLLLLAVAGLVAVTKDQIRDPRSTDSLLGFMVQLWLFFPVCYFVLFRPTVYDGIRHFLFLLPAMALLAGIGAARMAKCAKEATPRRLLTALILIFLLWPMGELIVLHPYQSSYFNAVVGGVEGAWEDYDTDYWASSYKEAAEWINARADEARERPLRVILAGTEHVALCAQHYLRSNVLFRTLNQRGVTDPLPPYVDYYVALTRRHYHENFPDAPVVHTVGRGGAVFAVIKQHAIGHGAR
jgi:hypothetical protein